MITRNSLSNTSEREFQQLVREVGRYNFTSSSEVSRFIRQNNLGTKYSHISGSLEMVNGEDSWNFDGGISPKYFARLCSALNLNHKGSNARVRRFRSYAEI